MSYSYSENVLVQGAAGDLLHDELGWELVYAHNRETLGANGTLGRTDYHQVLLTKYLHPALFRLNSWMTEAYADSVVKSLMETSFSATPMQTNEQKYRLITGGVPVNFRLPNGNMETRMARLIDFDNPANDHFLAVKEMKIDGALYHRRADIIGFVNGIPLLFVEFKKLGVDVRQAYDTNYHDYQHTIPQLFWFNAFVMLSNGVESKIGTLGSKYEYFSEWKRLNEGEQGVVSLETMLRGICKKETFLDLLENFIIYDHSDNHTAKILARNHQYLGVNEAIEAYRDRKLRDGKLGVFWHTQGSGKSYSMVFLSQKIRRKFSGSPTIIVLTDRDELNKQISATFESCGCLNGMKSSTFVPSSGARLVEMLKGNPSYIFTLIQKFNNDHPDPITPNHDIIIMSDEAHRTQNGLFADNMMKLLPTASRIGFTGTPLFAYDNITERTFGGYISVYDFKRAVDDGSTVPLYYENRADQLEITNPNISNELTDLLDSENLTPDQQAKMERELAKDIHIITAEKRLRAIAKDFVKHYTDMWDTGKAMFVCINKVTCVRMYNFVQEYWQDAIRQLDASLRTVSQQEAQEMQRKLAWMKETEMAVVISQEQNEWQTFDNWGLDIRPHRAKMEERRLDKEFKDSENPFRVVFVCAMWLTGFDVKSLSCLYLDKPLKAHTLMQAIARANRVCEGKTNGLVIDYIGVVKALRQALADYTSGGRIAVDPTPDISQLYSKIRAVIDEIRQLMLAHSFNLDTAVCSDSFARIESVQDGADALSGDADTRKRFGIIARELFRMFKYVEHGQLDSERKEKDAISAIYDVMHARVLHADNSTLMKRINDIVSDAIDVRINDDNKDKTFDISKIDFERLRAEFMRRKHQNLLLRDLQQLIEGRLAEMMARNPTRIDYYERYQTIISNYNAEQNRAAIEKSFTDLLALANELDIETERYIREGFDNEEQLALFDLLKKDTLSKEEIKMLKASAKELLSTIRKAIANMNNWREKETTRAEMAKIIRDTLWHSLPTSYTDADMTNCRQKIYTFVVERSPMIAGA